MQNANMPTPIGPVLTQIKTYSESGGISDNSLNLFHAGMFSEYMPIPIPHGASFIYFAMAALFTSRTFADASFLSNADLIRRICWLPFPIFVKTRSIKNKAPIIALGIIIRTDLERTRNTANPPIIQKMAVRVPD